MEAKERWARAWGGIAVTGAALWSFIIAPGISVADATWMVVAAVFAIKFGAFDGAVLRAFGPFVIYTGFITGWHFARDNDVEGVTSWLRLVFFVVATAIILPQVRKDRIVLPAGVEIALTLFGLAGVAQYVSVALLGGEPWPAFGVAGFAGDANAWRLRGEFRAGGLFGEPSWLGIFCALSIAYLTDGGLHLWSRRIVLIGIAGVAVTFSLASYWLLLTVWMLRVVQNALRAERAMDRWRVLSVGILVLALLAPWLVTSEVSRKLIVRRAEVSALLTDPSATDRILGSAELTLYALAESPIVGVGFAGLETKFSDWQPDIRYKHNPTGSVASAAAFVIGSTGLLGTIIFIMSLVRVVLGSGRPSVDWGHILAVALAFTMLWNFMLASPFWLFLLTTVRRFNRSSRQ